MINKDLVIKNLKYNWINNKDDEFCFMGVTFKINSKFLEVYNDEKGAFILYHDLLIDSKNQIEFIINDLDCDKKVANAFIGDLVDILKNIGVDNDNTIPKRYLTKSGKNFIDILKNEMLADEEFKGFVKGCMLKYIFRYENKGGLEDLKKADNYLKMLEDIERGNNND